jgi:hypothetical protein
MCGSYWVFNVREAHVVTESEARSDFPGAFLDRTNGIEDAPNDRDDADPAGVDDE